jgi:hypothetical protein
VSDFSWADGIGATGPVAAEEFGRDVFKLELFHAFMDLGGAFFSGSSWTGRILDGSLSAASDPQHRNLKGILRCVKRNWEWIQEYVLDDR